MIITLCGSTKFADEYKFWNLLLTLDGNVVYSCSIMGHSEKIQFNRKQKSILDVIHLQKINLSDAIFVINKDDYIGESTEREIMYAEQNQKHIFLLKDYTESIDHEKIIFKNRNPNILGNFFSVKKSAFTQAFNLIYKE